ncbi:hypothetical protein J0X19_01865 [Hymenobacter sp. BT186]|uniref:Uncharacterized protein n=1 Tax=Hymenobacter telluris TaxID=2816474 RepID=A0A939J949_9BACT|nr:hypothetical protein [Hymenobacter telluris]MBO0356681.1 hypothetical protein [Hymenobacter telluris]MBW3372706.1 hypothetical protein [Hymenobacter norwichensis]
MNIDLSNEFIQDATGFLALFTPIILLVRSINAVRDKSRRTPHKVLIIGLLLIATVIIYTIGLEIHQAIFLGIMSLFIFGLVLIIDLIDK